MIQWNFIFFISPQAIVCNHIVRYFFILFNRTYVYLDGNLIVYYGCIHNIELSFIQYTFVLIELYAIHLYVIILVRIHIGSDFILFYILLYYIILFVYILYNGICFFYFPPQPYMIILYAI